ncbi:MAG TPA: hypothetical protein VM285_17615 [Polyangia bacterium]|nr:hypothetical protein [Polyangia bacterium]
MLERDDDGARLVATNGRLLAVVPVTADEGDIPGTIPAEAVREACKARSAANPEAQVDANGSVRVTTKPARVTDSGRAVPAGPVAEFEREDSADVAFPQWRRVVPDSDSTPTYRVALSARYLLALARAIGTDDAEGAVELEFREPTGAIVVRPTPQGEGRAVGAFGVLMPISYEGLALPKGEGATR